MGKANDLSGRFKGGRWDCRDGYPPAHLKRIGMSPPCGRDLINFPVGRQKIAELYPALRDLQANIVVTFPWFHWRLPPLNFLQPLLGDNSRCVKLPEQVALPLFDAVAFGRLHLQREKFQVRDQIAKFRGRGRRNDVVNGHRIAAE